MNDARLQTDNILHKIAEIREKRLALEKQLIPLNALEARAVRRPPPRDFTAVFSEPGIHIIAEVKKASPSKGVLKPDLDASSLAKAYQRGGACAVSVVTEQDHFQGSLAVLESVRDETDLPILRKDFITDPYQVVEARTAGADSFLLIAALLDRASLIYLMDKGHEWGMEPLVEVHDLEQLDRALESGAKLIGINNRDLTTFRVDLNVSADLAARVPDDRMVISESGIKTRQDIERLSGAGVRGFLMGESLVTSPDPAAKIRELVNGNGRI